MSLNVHYSGAYYILKVTVLTSQDNAHTSCNDSWSLSSTEGLYIAQFKGNLGKLL